MKIFNTGLWPIIIILALAGTLIWFGIEFKSRGDELKAEKVLTDSLTIKVTDQQADIVAIAVKSKLDSSNYAKTIQATQSTCAALKADRDYWQGYATKVESGIWCPEYYGLLKKKKRLVKCNPDTQ